MYKQLTSAILRYLLDNHFDSSADMARHFDMTERHMQRIVKEGADAKGGTIALDKAICYCAQRHISLDTIVEECMASSTKEAQSMQGQPAYTNLRLACPEHLPPEGVEMYHAMLRFLQKVSAQVCPACRTWCNPWSGKEVIEGKDCYVGQIAQEIVTSLYEIYGKEGEEHDPDRPI